MSVLNRFLILLSLSLLVFGCTSKGSYSQGEFSQAGFSAPSLHAKSKPLNIIVLGGTSGVGLEVVKLSLERGHRVTAVARRPERMSLSHERLQTLKGDITQADSMADLLPGNDIVISAVGLPAGKRGVRLFSEGIKNILQIMLNQGMQRVITVSAIGAGESEGHGGFIFDTLLKPLVLGSDIEDKTRQENLLKQSAINYTIVRPAILTNDKSRKEYRVLTDLSGIETGSISRADVAHFIIAAAEQSLYVRNAVTLSN